MRSLPRPVAGLLIVVLLAQAAGGQVTTPVPGKVTARQGDVVHVTFQPVASASPAIGDSVEFSRTIGGREARAGGGRVTELIERAAVVRVSNGRPDFETTAVILATGRPAPAASPPPPPPRPAAPAPDTARRPPDAPAPALPQVETRRSVDDPGPRPQVVPPQQPSPRPPADYTPPSYDPPPTQRPAKPPHRYGLIAGINSSTYRTSGFDESVSDRQGFQAGFFVHGAANRFLAFESDVLYAQKGAAFPDSDGFTAQHDWVQVNVLAHFRLAPSSVATPFLLVGPSASFGIRCRYVNDNPDDAADCDEFSYPPKTNDYAVIAGGGIELGAFIVSARLEQGLANISSESGRSVKNRVLSLTAGVLFGQGR